MVLDKLQDNLIFITLLSQFSPNETFMRLILNYLAFFI